MAILVSYRVCLIVVKLDWDSGGSGGRSFRGCYDYCEFCLSFVRIPSRRMAGSTSGTGISGG